MRKKKTTQNATETIKAAASKAVKAVKSAPIAETAEKAANAVKETAEKVAEEAPEFAENISAKAEEFINSPFVEESRETLKETTEKAVKAARTIRTKVTGVTLEIFETNVSLEDIEKAVKKDVSDRNLKGEIKIYINAERRAAYYTVNNEGSDVYKIDLRTI